MAKRWYNAKAWTTTENSSIKYLVSKGQGQVAYETIPAGQTKKTLVSNGVGNVSWQNLYIQPPNQGLVDFYQLAVNAGGTYISFGIVFPNTNWSYDYNNRITVPSGTSNISNWTSKWNIPYTRNNVNVQLGETSSGSDYSITIGDCDIRSQLSPLTNATTVQLVDMNTNIVYLNMAVSTVRVSLSGGNTILRWVPTNTTTAFSRNGSHSIKLGFVIK